MDIFQFRNRGTGRCQSRDYGITEFGRDPEILDPGIGIPRPIGHGRVVRFIRSNIARVPTGTSAIVT